MKNEVSLVLFINITKFCNLYCGKCYLLESSRLSKKTLPITVFEGFLSDKYFDGKNLTIIIEGGEAVTVGEKGFNQYCDAVLKIRPLASLTLVTNLVSCPNWLIRSVKKYMNSKMETTFALKGKSTIQGSEESYHEKFKKNLKKAISSGIDCPVNVEVNKETFEMGPREILKLANITKAKKWEFDISIDFERFISNPEYMGGFTPVLPMSITHEQFSNYLSRFIEEFDELKGALGIESSCFHKDMANAAFNTLQEAFFITLNPDGSVTTNPLYSDLSLTFLGNVKNQSLSQILNHKNRLKRIENEQIRITSCVSCQYYTSCNGGPSHVPLLDQSNECAGHFNYLQKLK